MSVRRYAVVVMVDVEHGVNESRGTETNVQQYVSKVLGSNMGHQRDRGIPLKVKGIQAGKATKVAR